MFDERFGGKIEWEIIKVTFSMEEKINSLVFALKIANILRLWIEVFISSGRKVWEILTKLV